MSRYLRDLHRSLTLKVSRAFFRGGARRQLQEQIDIHRLFLFTSLHKHKQQLSEHVPDGLVESLIQQAKSVPFEEQRTFVHQQLCKQLANIAAKIDMCLQQAQDPRPAAIALEQSWQRLHSTQASSSSSAQIAAAGKLISQHKLSDLLQQQLGYSLSVRPSLIKHQEAGQGLFVEGHILPGSLVALFPGLVYHKPVYRRMPGYPRIDVGNPYLTARYDGGVVDSLPWGRGWQADGQTAPHIAGSIVTQRQGWIGRMVTASDGPRKPIPQTTWVTATTAEAAALELLEGRHPLALGHYANHPPAGSQPNAVIASFTFKLDQLHSVAADSISNPAGISSSGSSTATVTESSRQHGSRSSSQSTVAPWLRAYVPNINYSEECSTEHLLTREVSCVGLVAIQALHPGSEVWFSYRLSPALLGRPAWYVPVDPQEENMRWA